MTTTSQSQRSRPDSRALSAAHGLLLVDKPSGCTSHDVVARARRAFGCRSVGHAGTLDPLATGLLLVLVGHATRLVPYLMGQAKSYDAAVLLGAETDTLDAEGTIVRRSTVPRDLDRTRIETAAQEFVGAKLQVPPAFSAIKRDGQVAYKRARRGEAVELPPRLVELHSFAAREPHDECIHFSIRCGKGFYVRALARDLAERLGTVGHLIALRRTSVGPFGLSGALPFAQLEAGASGDLVARRVMREALIAPAAACPWLTKLSLDAAALVDVRHGRPVALERFGERPPLATEAHALLTDLQGRLVAIARRDGNLVRVVRGFPDPQA